MAHLQQKYREVDFGKGSSRQVDDHVESPTDHQKYKVKIDEDPGLFCVFVRSGDLDKNSGRHDEESRSSKCGSSGMATWTGKRIINSILAKLAIKLRLAPICSQPFLKFFRYIVRWQKDNLEKMIR